MALCTTALMKMIEGLVGGLLGSGATLWALRKGSKRKEGGEKG